MGRPTGSRWRRRVIVTCVGLEIAYLVAVHLFLNTSLGPNLVNQKPEKSTITWQSGWSPFPGPVMIRGLVWERRSPSVDFRLEARELSLFFHTLPLVAQRIWISRIRAVGVSMAMLSVPPGERLPAKKPNPRKKPGWRLWMRDMRISEVERFSFDDLAVSQGEGGVEGNVSYQERALVGIDEVSLEWREAVVSTKNPESDEMIVVAEPFTLTFEGGIAPFDEIDVGGPAVIPYFYGQIGLEGVTEKLAVLDIFFANVPWLEKVEGRGEVSALLAFRKGRLLSPTRVEVSAQGLNADFLGWSAAGTGRIEGEVSGPDESSVADLKMIFDTFAIRRVPEARLQVEGEGLRISATARDPFLPGGFQDLEVLLDVPESRVPDFGVFSQYLPERLGLSEIAGSATMIGHLEARTATQRAEGALSVIAEGVKTRFYDLDVETRLELDARVSGTDLADWRLGLEGTSLRVTEGVFRDGKKTEEEGWWMTVNVTRGTAKLKAPVEIQGDVELSMKDTRALVAVFAETKTWLERFEGLLTVEDIKAETKVRMEDQVFSLRGLDLEGKNLEAGAELDLVGGSASGLLYLNFHGIDVGLELENNERAWKIIRARKWFDEARAERGAERAEEGPQSCRTAGPRAQPSRAKPIRRLLPFNGAWGLGGEVHGQTRDTGEGKDRLSDLVQQVRGELSGPGGHGSLRQDRAHDHKLLAMTVNGQRQEYRGTLPDGPQEPMPG